MFVVVLLFFLFWVVLAVWLDVFLFSRTSQFRKVPEGFRKLFRKLNKHCYWGSRFLRVPEVSGRFPEAFPEAMFWWKHRKQFVLCHFVLVHLRALGRGPRSGQGPLARAPPEPSGLTSLFRKFSGSFPEARSLTKPSQPPKSQNAPGRRRSQMPA